MGTFGVESTKAHKTARLAIDRDRVPAHADFPLRQVPVSNIETRVADDPHVFEVSENQIEPALLEMHSRRNVMTTVFIHPVLPPRQERPSFGFVRDPKEADVVDT